MPSEAGDGPVFANIYKYVGMFVNISQIQIILLFCNVGQCAEVIKQALRQRGCTIPGYLIMRKHFFFTFIPPRIN